MRLETTKHKSKIGAYLKCQNPENQLQATEFEELFQSYKKLINNRIWQSQQIPSSKKAKSLLDCQFIVKNILLRSDRSLFTPLTLQNISDLSGLSFYKTKQLLSALEEMNILVFNNRGVQLRNISHSVETISDRYNRLMLNTSTSNA